MIEVLIDSPIYRYGTTSWMGKSSVNAYDKIIHGKNKELMPYKLNATGEAGRHPLNIITEDIFK